MPQDSWRVVATFSGFAGVELAAFWGLDGLFQLMVSLAVLLLIYTAALWMTRETIFVRVWRSVRTAIAGNNRIPIQSHLILDSPILIEDDLNPAVEPLEDAEQSWICEQAAGDLGLQPPHRRFTLEDFC